MSMVAEGETRSLSEINHAFFALSREIPFQLMVLPQVDDLTMYLQSEFAPNDLQWPSYGVMHIGWQILVDGFYELPSPVSRPPNLVDAVNEDCVVCDNDEGRRFFALELADEASRDGGRPHKNHSLILFDPGK